MQNERDREEVRSGAEAGPLAPNLGPLAAVFAFTPVDLRFRLPMNENRQQQVPSSIPTSHSCKLAPILSDMTDATAAGVARRDGAAPATCTDLQTRHTDKRMRHIHGFLSYVTGTRILYSSVSGL